VKIRIWLAPLAALPIAMGLAACGSSSDAPTAGTGSEVTAPRVAAPADPGAKGVVSAEYLKALVGMSEQDATMQAMKDGYTVRVIMRDDEPLPATKDFRPDRINLSVKGADVADATPG